uniref:Uncharacterized protein LOC104216622 n=1 Tax=Nicotiana sylvestris TaxID=4096 RepID=A0A1U7VSW6_NICSY|nr:PREDICTED: uncharacterized protein LOC104216622 [Nicotiana sylvestris]
MSEAREEVEYEILWEMNKGNTNVWHENRTSLGSLYHVIPPEFLINEELQEVADLRDEEGWNDQLLKLSFPMEIDDNIRQEVQFDNNDDYWDTPRWISTSSGNFSISSAWRILRHRAPTNPEYGKLWTKGSRIGGQSGTGASSNKSMRRNTMKDGGAVSCNRVIHEVNKTLHFLVRVRYPWLPRIPLLWPKMIRLFEGYKPIVVTIRVTWQLPYKGWFKCNTDGASRGYPGPSSYGFCVQDHAGDLVFAKMKEIGETTNIVAKAKVLVEGLTYYVERQFHPLIMETDSLVLRKIINGEWETPWYIGAKVTKLLWLLCTRSCW